jgi:AraC-like DNA-binding protein
MESFQIIPPSAELAPYVKNYWFLTCEAADERQRIIPGGCVSLVFHRGARMFSPEAGDFQPAAFLCGQSSEYGDLHHSGPVDMIHVTFRPFGARAFFGMPIDETRGLTIPVDALGDRALCELEEQLAGLADIPTCVARIEAYLLLRLSVSKAHHFGRMAAAVRAIDAGEADVCRLADLSCLGYKQFKRVFSEYVGANPKDFLRVVRFHRALHLKRFRPEIPLAQLAAEAGCYDQAHLNREFKVFSGYTPGEYFSICEPYSDYFG